MRIFRALFGLILILMVLAVAALVVLHQRWQPELQKVHTLENLRYGGRATLLDSQDRVIRVISVSRNGGLQGTRKFLTLSQISPWLQKAVVTSEDVRFEDHHGIDLRGLSRALWKTLSGELEGGSTITQQVVKNTLLADLRGARTLERKLKEAFLAVETERQFSKKEILEMYLNLSYWGVARTDLVGAGDAARAYFGKNARDLTLAESVYLTVLLPTPVRFEHFQAYRPLMKDLLSRMVEAGHITQQQADAAWKSPIQPAGWTVKYGKNGEVLNARLTHPQARKQNFPVPEYRYADAFVDQVTRELLQRVPEKAFYTSEIKVYTTLDRKTQLAAEQASMQATVPAGATLGMAFMNPLTGDVKALVGQKLGDGVLEEWNHSTRSKRQVGSSIKPLLYTLALEKGWKQSDTVLDLPLEGDYQPKNFSQEYSARPITLRRALNYSLNLPTVRLLQQVGVEPFRHKLGRLGLQPGADAGLSLGIGALEATPLQMAAAYVPFANGGMYRAPRLIRSVTSNGKPLLKVGLNRPSRVWSPPVSYLGFDLIRGVVNDLTPAQGGLGWNARIPGWQVGGKTGTTNDVRDLWFVGVTPRLAGAVWVGKSNNAAMPNKAYSGEVAAPIWQQAMSGALQGEKPIFVDRPREVYTEQITGLDMTFLRDPATSTEVPVQNKTLQKKPVKPDQQSSKPATTGSVALQVQNPGKAKAQNWKPPLQKTRVVAQVKKVPQKAVVQKTVFQKTRVKKAPAVQTPVAPSQTVRRQTQTRPVPRNSDAQFLERQKRKAEIAQRLGGRARTHFEQQYRRYRDRQ